MNKTSNSRILLIDDTPAIHLDFRKILAPETVSGDLDEVEAALFGGGAPATAVHFELESAYQGQEGVAKVCASLQAGLPYAMAFVDMRMPPGWDGVETIERLWQADPRLQIVICTAYADYSWEEMLERLDVADRLLILKKPFDAIEVCQLASALTAKYGLARQAAVKLTELEQAVAESIAELRRANAALTAEIDEHARTEAELRLAASVFENTMDGVMITDAAAAIVSVNPAFTAITGYDAGEALGRTPALLRSDHHGPEFFQQFWQSLQRDGRWEGEIWNRRKNGEVFLEWLRISAVQGDDGRPLRYVGVFNDITELRKKDEHIRHLAFHDPLTGLPNRALLLDRLERSLSVAVRKGQQRLGVMFIDLDRFKHINDSLGHDVGDGLLQEVAGRLGHNLRASDTVARIGGDEFVVLLSHAEEPEAYAGLAQKMIVALAQPMTIAGHAIQVGASVGIACFPEDGADVVTLMKHADAAMYAAKAAGRGTYRFFQAAMTEKAEQRLRLEMELRQAVKNGELELFYQPRVALDSGALVGLEALVRWRHPEHGLVSPAEFIPLAEETGIIAELGDWVLEEACRQSREWHSRGLGTRIAVNVSAKQLQTGGLVERIAELARRYGTAPADLEIELTESVVMANPEQVSGTFVELRRLGVSVAVDDFGTGYSSLAYLRRLPLDVLKIDRSFVCNADCDEGDAQIVKTIIALGQALGLAVVAEGVETESQAAFLRSCGCPTGQGFLYSRPQPAAAIEAWLQPMTAGELKCATA